MSSYGITADQLKSYIERLERLEEEKKNIAEDIKEVFAEAKGNGFDTKTMKVILKLRKIEPDDLQEQEYLLDTYKRALGMLPEIDQNEEASSAENSAKQDNKVAA